MVRSRARLPASDRLPRLPGKGETERAPPPRTMAAFAAFVGLSRPTVSRFFNDPASLRETTRRRIALAVEASGFQPNLLAANLVRRRSNIVGIIIPDPVDPFYTALTRRVQAIASEAGFHAFVLSSDGDRTEEARAVGTLAAMSVAGIIVAPLGGSEGGGALERMQTDIPIVYVDSPPARPAAFVGTDNRASFALMVDHLCDTGTPPRFLAMPAVNANAASRAEAYDAAMRARGFEPILLPLPNARDWDFERVGFEASAAWIAAGGVAGATVLCANDRLAFGALAAAWQAGVRVGRAEACDLRIAGHDDHPLSRYACPPLTTVAQDYDEIAGRAMAILLRRLAEEAPAAAGGEDLVLLGARVVARESA
ncbi:DNA-binding LacI/PurR family transcriptional regulator [Aureimonas pseudogalii]|uniref:DNA-binding LacI/PurR family transcriptional regulator n=2 Tax=Aureimonas pseudogalii TaxID=1744844 RepID=A0A7W6EF23_9HYPH|nr:DNA-binding LacI/PurR family transcriptional regulator [Aureimonas pseudogalii]